MYKSLQLLNLQRLYIPDFLRIGHDGPVRAKFPHLGGGMDRLLDPLLGFLHIGVIDHLLCLQVYGNAISHTRTSRRSDVQESKSSLMR